MKIKNLFKRKKTIKKPYWAKSVAISTAIFFVIYALLLLLIGDQVYWEFSAYMSSDRYITGTLSELGALAKDGLSDEEKEAYVNRLNHAFIMMEIPATFTYEGEVICDTQNKMMVNYDGFTKNDSDAKPLDNVFIYSWDPETNQELYELYKNQITPSLTYMYQANLCDGYFNPVDHTFYPGKVDFYRYPNMGFSSKDKLIKEYDFTPEDKSVLEGYEYVVFDDQFVTASNITGPITDENFMYTYNDHISCIFDQSADNARIAYAWKLLNIIVIAVVLVISILVGTISFLRANSVYKIFEYRQKTTNAMAHDLKTPLAIMSLSVANLKESINTDPANAIKHADQIEESINYSNELINKILDLSKSESGVKKIKKETFDAKEEINKYVESIKDVAAKRGITIEVTGSSSLNTDLTIWKQAISNLIDNAVKHSIDGGKVLISINEKEITISNPIEKDIESPKKLKEPFVKGENSRGENSGSGLGLSIADNNLSSLGYSLNIECKNKNFKVIVN